jgi:hypothetical protein
MKGLLEKQISGDFAKNEYGAIQFDARFYEVAVHSDGKVRGEDVQGMTVPECGGPCFAWREA